MSADTSDVQRLSACAVGILLTSVIAAAQPNGGGPGPVLGIVEIPELFHIDRDTGTYAPRAALTVYTRPDSGSKVMAVISSPRAIDDAEYGYEEGGALVYGRQHGYFLIRTARASVGFRRTMPGLFIRSNRCSRATSPISPTRGTDSCSHPPGAPERRPHPRAAASATSKRTHQGAADHRRQPLGRRRGDQSQPLRVGHTACGHSAWLDQTARRHRRTDRLVPLAGVLAGGVRVIAFALHPTRPVRLSFGGGEPETNILTPARAHVSGPFSHGSRPRMTDSTRSGPSSRRASASRDRPRSPGYENKVDPALCNVLLPGSSDGVGDWNSNRNGVLG